MKRKHVLFGLLALAVGLMVFRPYLGGVINPVIHRVTGGNSVADRLEQFGAAARGRMGKAFELAEVDYPPTAVTLVAIKAKRVLHVYAGNEPGVLRPVLTYSVLGQSGELGPKLREGDRQVPEGLYRITGLNPNSQFHVSLRVNYPNAFDLENAAAEGRDEPGSDIFIHGGSASIGCLAMGDPVAEELFTLVADVGTDEVRLVIAPIDFRVAKGQPEAAVRADWVADLYTQIEQVLRLLPDAP